MSHIFDALQRSETERSGNDFPGLSTATELLEAAERDTALAHADASEAHAMNLSEVAVEPEGVNLLQRVATASTAEEFSTNLAPELSEVGSGANQFSQFRSLRLLIPPQSKVVCVTDRESLAAEKFRFLGVRLRQLRQNRSLRKVLITSTIPQEGKTMIAANLACTLARKPQQRTLLVEGDLRRPSLGNLFGLGKVSGISNWLQGDCDTSNSIYHLDGPGFWIMPAGNVPRNPLELIQSARLPYLMSELAAQFDWIIIDSPPVLPLADTSIWMRLADGILLVARQGTTEKKQLQRGLEAIETSKLLGAILNGAPDAAHSDYYHYYGTSNSTEASKPADSGSVPQPAPKN